MKRFFLLICMFSVMMADESVAVVKNIEGSVFVKHKPHREVMHLGDRVNPGDTLVSRDKNKVQYMFSRGVLIAPNPKGGLLIERKPKKIPLNVGDPLYEGDLILTGKESSVGILFSDDSTLALGENSIIILAEFVYGSDEDEQQFTLDFKKGTAAFESGKIGKEREEDFEFKVPEGTIAIRGTKFCVMVPGEE